MPEIVRAVAFGSNEVAFDGQRNPDGHPQTTTVWPVQKVHWRDLTLGQRPDAAQPFFTPHPPEGPA